MKVKRPSFLFLSSEILGILLATGLVSKMFLLILFLIAIFLYLKIFLDGKLKFSVIVLIIIIGALSFFRFKYVEKVFDTNVSNIENLGKGNKIITGKVESIGKSTNSNYLILSECRAGGLDIGKCRCYYADLINSNIKIGNYVKVNASVKTIEEPANEGEFNQKLFYRSDEIVFFSYANDIEITNNKCNLLKQSIYEIKLIVKNQIGKIFNEKDAGLFSAMITGDKSSIDLDQKKRFSDNGIAHILAISGLHLSILGLMLFEILRKKLKVNTAAFIVTIFISLYGIFIDASAASLRAIIMLLVRFLSLSIGRTYDSKNTLYITAFIFILYKPYLIFNAGFQFSYVAIFALNHKVTIGNYIMGISKKEHLEKLYAKDEFSESKNKERKKVPEVLILTLFLFPITIYHYFTYPLYSILLNLIVIPLMSFVLGFGLIGLLFSFINLQIGRLIVYVVHIIFVIYDSLCEFVETLPLHLLTLGRPTIYEILYYYVALFIIFYALSKIYLKIKYKNLREPDKESILNEKGTSKKEHFEKLVFQECDEFRGSSGHHNSKKLKFRLFRGAHNLYSMKQKIYILCRNVTKIVLIFILLILSILIISVRKRSDMRMTFISIGQGDSIIIESQNLILSIDGGSTSNKSNGQYILSPHLKSRAIDHIDYAYITHADADHTNGIIYLLENEEDFKIGNLILPITAMNDKKFDKLKNAAEKSNTKVCYMKETEIKKFKDYFVLTVLSPEEKSLSLKKIDQNEMSLTFRLDYKNHSALFTGDIGKDTMNRMLNDEFSKNNMDVDVLKVPHHGSKNSNAPDFFNLVSPKYSVFSYGKNNNYGHPSSETVDSVLNTGSIVLKTGESGQIDILFDKENIEYFTYKGNVD